MSRASRFAVAALACCVAFSGAVLGQAPPPPPTTPLPPPTPTDAPRNLRAKDVLGSKVNIQGNLAIGTVDDIIFDDGGTIDYLVVLNDGKYVTVPWEAAKFDFDKRTATVEINQERFREIPTYTVEQYPRFYEPAYREKIYGFYGVKPRRDIRPPDRREPDRREEKPKP